MQARYNQMSLSHYMATCPKCLKAAAAGSSDTILARVENFSANWAGYFTPSFFFLVAIVATIGRCCIRRVSGS